MPAHPLAGTEFSGPDAGLADLFQGRWCLLTPPPDTDEEAVEKIEALWGPCGADRRGDGRPRIMTACMAIVSHLPHLHRVYHLRHGG